MRYHTSVLGRNLIYLFSVHPHVPSIYRNDLFRLGLKQIVSNKPVISAYIANILASILEQYLSLRLVTLKLITSSFEHNYFASQYMQWTGFLNIYVILSQLSIFSLCDISIESMITDYFQFRTLGNTDQNYNGW